MYKYSENLHLAFKQWHYNAMNGICRNYGFSVYSHYSEFRLMSYDDALEKINTKSPKLFSRLERMAESY